MRSMFNKNTQRDSRFKSRFNQTVPSPKPSLYQPSLGPKPRAHQPSPSPIHATSKTMAQDLLADSDLDKPKPIALLPPSKPSKPFEFLLLPGEIRMRIYHYAFPHDTFHIKWRNKPNQDLTYRPYLYRYSPGPCLDVSVGLRRRQFDLQRRLHSPEVKPTYKLSPSPTSLLLTCRQINHEATHLFYGSNTFVFASQRIFDKFLITLSTESKTAIKSLQLRHQTYGEPHWTTFVRYKTYHDEKWLGLCSRAAEELTGLERLTIHLTINDIPLKLNLEAAWAAPLRKFKGRGIKQCDIRLSHHLATPKCLKACGNVVRKDILGPYWQEQQYREVLPKALKCIRITWDDMAR